MAKEYQSFSYSSFIHNGQLKDFHFSFSQKKSPETTFADKEKNTFTKEICKIVAYDPHFDIASYHQLKSLQASCPQEYQQKKHALDTYTKRQLETHLGERFNVALSTTKYEIKDGHIYGENTEEPFLAMIKRGRDYRRMHGNPLDHPREDAEVTEMQKIEDVLGNPNTPIGTMMLAVSPPGLEGSTYDHNFYDVFTLRKNEQGEKYIETKRYSSALGYNEYADKIKQLQPDYFANKDEDTPSDAYFLANPLEVSHIFSSPDAIHAFLHKDHEFMQENDFQKIIKACEPFIHSYIQILGKANIDKNFLMTTYNAILNQADIVANALRNNSDTTAFIPFLYEVSPEVISALGQQPVRQVTTGCGTSGGFEINGTGGSFSVGISLGFGNRSPFSVAEFGSNEDRYGSLNFDCPHCQNTNHRERNKLIENCQYCGKDVRC